MTGQGNWSGEMAHDLNSLKKECLGLADALFCGAGLPTCGFTGLSSPVFQKDWRLESRLNPQTRMSAPHFECVSPGRGGFWSAAACSRVYDWGAWSTVKAREQKTCVILLSRKTF